MNLLDQLKKLLGANCDYIVHRAQINGHSYVNESIDVHIDYPIFGLFNKKFHVECLLITVEEAVAAAIAEAANEVIDVYGWEYIFANSDIRPDEYGLSPYAPGGSKYRCAPVEGNVRNHNHPGRQDTKRLVHNGGVRVVGIDYELADSKVFDFFGHRIGYERMAFPVLIAEEVPPRYIGGNCKDRGYIRTNDQRRVRRITKEWVRGGADESDLARYDRRMSKVCSVMDWEGS